MRHVVNVSICPDTFLSLLWKKNEFFIGVFSSYLSLYLYNKKRDTNSMKSRLSIQAVLTWLNLGGGAIT